MMSLPSSFLVLDKKSAITSQSCLSVLKRNFSIKKLGHTGTLDPLATGVLPVAIGEATKLIPFLDEKRKLYKVEAKLGEHTTTYDADGEIIAKAPYVHVEEKMLRQLLLQFRGNLNQVPPVFSAVKINGKPLYKYARQGTSIQAKAREVEVFRFDIIGFTPPYVQFLIECSRGTYVRSLVHDLGMELKCYAHVTQLRRLQSGAFSIEQSVTLEDLCVQAKELSQFLLPIEKFLQHIPELTLDTEKELQLLQNGNIPYAIQEKLGGFFETYKNEEGEVNSLQLHFKGKLIALLRFDSARNVERLRVLEL